MGRQIHFYFSAVSPWVYVGKNVFDGIVAHHKLEVTYRPVDLQALFAESGGLPLAKRHPLRQSYRWLELQRWREARDIKMNINPEFWPFDARAADHIIIAVQDRGIDPAPLLGRMLSALWVDEANLADENTLSALISAENLPADDIMTSAKTPSVAAVRVANTAEAEQRGVFGSPGVILDGEVFWGQDRYELLDTALHSGRVPYRPL